MAWLFLALSSGVRCARSRPASRPAQPAPVRPDLLHVVADHRAGAAAPRDPGGRGRPVRLGRRARLVAGLGRRSGCCIVSWTALGRSWSAGTRIRAHDARGTGRSRPGDDEGPRCRCERDRPVRHGRRREVQVEAQHRVPQGGRQAPQARRLPTPATRPSPAAAGRPADPRRRRGSSATSASRASRCCSHLAANGWVGFNANYRLSPGATFPDHLVDLKRALAWIREHADEYGVDPDFVVVTGGSAGGHLTALMALTANDPRYQPGFEDADTSVQAAVPFYGVYDFTNRNEHLGPGGRHDSSSSRMVVKAFFDDEPEKFAEASPHRPRPRRRPAVPRHPRRPRHAGARWPTPASSSSGCGPCRSEPVLYVELARRPARVRRVRVDPRHACHRGRRAVPASGAQRDPCRPMRAWPSSTSSNERALTPTCRPASTSSPTELNSDLPLEPVLP